ncbi:type IV secretion system protein VirB4 [Bacillus toyonensis]|uniref:VirB4 family type IV secretion system protein n=1 Tax=Bacillus toyonensis TaxID=155322 RepID=UPI000BF129FC|nr:type IV secretion system protein VirB4 [Bacillus toyonensis]PEL51709.1 type IV secretion system protein VirB4 [Bacillus toyonensis]PEN46027.1 type IV secretion system protein VirB4 [Bacillus toyonensis]PGE05978.1 type IV secretion system protein VirB4 [Bacillus toyonensis]PGE08600.1 type IV secretion system protein VirB4 [Bacillus toyonensis]
MFAYKSKKSKKEKQEELKKKKGYNPYLVARVQPQGGISFKESYVQTGDGFATCIHVFDFPTEVNDFWLEQIMNMPNVITTLDVMSDDRKEVVESINKSMSEQSVRHDTAKDNIDRIDAKNEFLELEALYTDLKQGEVMKRIHIRIYVSARTLDELEKQVKEIMETLESYNFRGAVFLNEQEYEWDALVTSFDTQKNYVNRRKGKEIPAVSLAGGCPFHYSYLHDPYGTYYGTTKTKGNVIFDIFHKDNQRKSYNGVMIGKSGAGKSTLLKKKTVDYASKGHFVRVFDVVEEFTDTVEELGGKTIALDGSQGQINPLQVYKTAESEEVSFTQHLSKLTIIYRFIAPEAKDDEIKEYENLLRKLYIRMELWNDEKGAKNEITTRKSNEYPIFSDFLRFVRKELYQDVKAKKHHDNLGDSRIHRLELIELNLTNLVEAYAELFDGPTTIEDFKKEQVVSFSLRNISSFKPEVFQAQIFNVLNLLWNEMISNGAPQLKAFNKKQLAFEDVTRYFIIIDEAHHIINTKKESAHALQFLTKLSREDRKYFAGLLYASHTIRDFVPEGSSQEMIDEIKKLFELTQYKFIMQQDNNSLDMLRKVFAGQLSESEIAAIPHLPTGDVILSIGAVKNIHFHVEVTDEELMLFGGGA